MRTDWLTPRQMMGEAGVSFARLKYFQKEGLVCPYYGGRGEPAALYSRRQIEMVKLVDRASKWFTPDAIRTAIRLNRLKHLTKLPALLSDELVLEQMERTPAITDEGSA